MKRMILPLEMWQWDGWVVEGTSAEYTEFVKLIFDDDDGMDCEAAGGVYVNGDKKPWLLWVRDRKDPVIIAHEALHIVFSIMASRGVDLHDASEETFTYLLSYIVQAVLESKPSDWKKVNFERPKQ